MKKIIFYIAVVLATLQLIYIISVIIQHFSRLTEFGYGYLTGKFILLAILVAIAFLTKKKKLKQQG